MHLDCKKENSKHINITRRELIKKQQTFELKGSTHNVRQRES